MCLTSLGTSIKNYSIVKQWNKVLITQLLDKCLRDNKIAPLHHPYIALLSTCAKSVQFYCPSHTYAAIPYCTIFQFLAYCYVPLLLSTFKKATNSSLCLPLRGLSIDVSRKFIIKGQRVNSAGLGTKKILVFSIVFPQN